MMIELDTRFWSKVEKTDSCWNWTAYTSKLGYGQYGYKGKLSSPHRLSYEYFNGKIPKGMDLDHICRNPSCCNPKHLQVVTHQENVRRGLAGFVTGLRQRAKTHCPQGHEYTLKNTYIYPITGKRACRTCFRLRATKLRHLKKLELVPC